MSDMSNSKRWVVIIIIVILALVAIMYFLQPNPPPVITETPTERPVPVDTTETPKPVKPEADTVTPITLTSPPGDITPSVPTEAPTNPPEPSVSNLQFWFGGTSKDEEFLKEQIAAFEQENPDIKISLTLLTFTEIDAKLIASQESNSLPDVATVSLNLMVALQIPSNETKGNSLSDLGQLGTFDPNSFVPDAIQSGQIDGNQFGLPLRRFGCSVSYQFLSISESSKYKDQAFKWIDFLTQPDQQDKAYPKPGWIPTRSSSLSKLNLDCPQITLIPQTEDEIKRSLKIVPTIESQLKDVLKDDLGNQYHLDPYNAITIIENGEVQGTVAAAVSTTLTEDQAMQLLVGDGLVFGGMFLENAKEFPDPDSKYKDTPRNYVLKCKASYKPIVPLTVRKDSYVDSNNKLAYLDKGDRVVFEGLKGDFMKLRLVNSKNAELIGWSRSKYLVPDIPDGTGPINGTCLFVRSDGTSFEVDTDYPRTDHPLLTLDQVGIAVEKPVVDAEEGSIKLCFKVFRWKPCGRVG